jgi:hypothetical protein
MSFESKEEESWLPEQAEKDLITTLADLLLDAVDEHREGASDESKDPR